MLEECVLLADFTPDNSKSQQISAKAGEAVTVLKTDESGKINLCSEISTCSGFNVQINIFFARMVILL